MHLLVDTREQKPWRFHDSVKTTSQTLPLGDYMLSVPSPLTAVIERKSLPDLVQTLTRDADRFRRELHRLGELDYACVVVESSIPRLMQHPHLSEHASARVLDNVVSLTIDWGIPVVWAGDRPSAISYAMRWFQHVLRRET